MLTSGNTTLRTYTPDYFVNWDNSVWQQYLARGSAQVRNGAVSAVFDGVPYIAVQSWNPTRVNVSDLDAFLDRVVPASEKQLRAAGESIELGRSARDRV